MPLNRTVFVKRKDNLLSAGADHVSTIIIVYQPVIWLFSCDLRGISIGDLPASLPIKGWISLPNHVTYAHNWGNKEAHIREISPFHTLFSINGLSFLHFCKWRTGGEPYMPRVLPSLSPLTDCYFYTSANGEQAVAVHASCLSFVVSIDGLLLLHFCKWRTGSSRTCLVSFLRCLH